MQRPRGERAGEGSWLALVGAGLSLGRKEMTHLPGAVERPGASVETRPQEPGTMAGNERNADLAAAALPLSGP